jgi:hypothetical protein
MYEENCGLDKVTMSWGHDEYMYRMLQHNKSTLPEEAFYIIRQEKITAISATFTENNSLQVSFILSVA